MKSKHFKKIRKIVKWYQVSYREDRLFDFRNKKTILAKSPENACMRYHKRTGCFVNKRCGEVEQTTLSFARFKVKTGNKIMHFD